MQLRRESACTAFVSSVITYCCWCCWPKLQPCGRLFAGSRSIPFAVWAIRSNHLDWVAVDPVLSLPCRGSLRQLPFPCILNRKCASKYISDPFVSTHFAHIFFMLSFSPISLCFSCSSSFQLAGCICIYTIRHLFIIFFCIYMRWPRPCHAVYIWL